MNYVTPKGSPDAARSELKPQERLEAVPHAPILDAARTKPPERSRRDTPPGSTATTDLIIAGRFSTKTVADLASITIGQYVSASDISIFHNNPAGQHDLPEASNEVIVDLGAEGAPKHAMQTALAAGLTAGAIGMIAGPVVAVTAAGIAAYTGSLVGALDGLGDKPQTPDAPQRRQGGVMLAVHLLDPANEVRVIRDLREAGAVDIERARGEWRAGDWVSFNPQDLPEYAAA